MTKIKFDSERHRYTVQAFDDRFIVCTKPFNVQKTYLYSVVDLLQGKRGSFGKWGPPRDMDTPAGAKLMIDMLQSWEATLPCKNMVPLTESEISQCHLVIGGVS